MSNDTQASIPARYILAASKDAELRLLLRQVETAGRRVAKALEAEADAKGAVADYVAEKYPAPDIVDRLSDALRPLTDGVE